MMRIRCRTGLIAIVVALLPTIVMAHTRPRPTPENVWAAWYVDPLIATPILVASWLYLRGVRDLWNAIGEEKVISHWNRRAWFGVMASLAIALFSPIDALGGALFSAHMVQHLILFVVVPWLLAYSRPGLGMWWGMPASWRTRVGGGIGSRPLIRQLHSATRNPMLILIVFTVVLWLWHTPALYNAALRSDFVHALEHFSFMAGAYLLWSWLLSVGIGRGGPSGGRQGLAIMIVFATVMQSGVLGAILTFARTPLYEMHEGYTAMWGMTLIEDQQLAGVLMWVPMGLTFTLVGLLLFRSMLLESERQARRKEEFESSPPANTLTEAQS